jgi:hypothetical protein
MDWGTNKRRESRLLNDKIRQGDDRLAGWLTHILSYGSTDVPVFSRIILPASPAKYSTSWLSSTA